MKLLANLNDLLNLGPNGPKDQMEDQEMKNQISGPSVKQSRTFTHQNPQKLTFPCENWVGT